MEYTYVKDWKTQVRHGDVQLSAAEIVERLNWQANVIARMERLLKNQTTYLQKAEETMRFLEGELLKYVKTSTSK